MEIKDNVLISVSNKDIVNGTFVIPNNITEIGLYAFADSYLLKQIVIPDNVIKIATGAFSSCTNLEEVILSENLRVIADAAFCQCTELKKIKIPNSVTNMGQCVFMDCFSLEEVFLSENLMAIEDCAFMKCINLEQLTLPQNLSTIGHNAFGGCSNLKKIKLPDHVTKICGSAFRECESLEQITLPPKITVIEEELFFDCKKLQKIEIPEDVTEIGESAFKGCFALKDITFPNNLQEIGKRAFKLCSSLNSIVIPDNITTINSFAFDGCISLEQVTLPTTLQSIEKAAFCNCTRLKNIIIPDNVTNIGVSAFGSCTALEEITLPEKLTIISKEVFCYCESLKEIIIPKNVISIGASAFKNCIALERVSLPDSVNEIGKNVFCQCTSLEEITLPEKLTIIPEAAFYKCTSLNNIIIPDGVMKIDVRAFCGCVSLEKMIFPGSLTEINTLAFSGCKALKRIDIPTGVASIAKYVFSDCTKLEQITFQNNLKYISDYAFNNTALKEIVLPESLRYIEKDALYDCKNLKSIEFKSSLTKFDYELFIKSSSLKKIIFHGYEMNLATISFSDLESNVFYIRKMELSDKMWSLLIEDNHIYNLKRENFDYLCENNYNFGEIITDIIFKINNYTDYAYEEDIEKFDALFPNTRFSNLPRREIFTNLNNELASKYNVKIIRELMKLSVFNQTYETRLNIIDVVAVFGLFEKDKDVYSRLNTLKKLFELNLYLSEEDFNRISNFEYCYEMVEKNVYILKDNVTIPEELKEYLKEVMYDYNLSILKKLDKRIGKLANDFFKENYVLTKKNYYHPIQNIEPNILMEIYNDILNSRIRNQITVESLNRIFNNSPKKYNEKALNFIVKYFKLILSDEEYQSKVRDILINYNEIEWFYKSKGNNNFNFIDAIEYLKNVSFANINEGNHEFAALVKNSGVTNQEKFEKYQELYETMKKRRKSIIPRINEDFLIDINGQDYKIGIEILRKDDPFALLVGESKYTNCCQKLDDTGEPCMLHSINEGRVFCTYLIDENNNKILLSESWVWRCGNMICFDNIEGTNIMKDNKVYRDIVASCYKLAGEKLINIGKENNDKIEVISIGKGYDDLGLEKYFDKNSQNSVKPKGYNRYVDSGMIYYVIGSKSIINESSDEKEIYADERRIVLQSGFSITSDIISKIKRIEKNHKKEMIQYEDISNISELSNVLEADKKNINILLGEDWYYIYSVENEKIKIHDLVKEEAAFKEETSLQLSEIRKAFYEILKKSIVVENDDITLKEIEADLREDTSYILFLKQVKDGTIILLEENAYDYNTQEKIVPVYEDPLKHIKEIRQNDRIIMHKVRFKVNDKMLDKYMEQNSSKKI